MIQMKEKKLVLPNYYKTILEKGKPRRLTRKQMTRRDDRKESKSKSNKKYRKLSIFQNDNNNEINSDKKVSDNHIDNDYINNPNININNIRKEEYEKILNYKNYLIFQTPDEFQDRLSNFEKENVQLLTYKDELNHHLFRYKRELQCLTKDDNIMEVNKRKINLKESELLTIKNIVEQKIKIIFDFKKTKENLEKEFKKVRDKPKNIKYKNKDNENLIENNIDKKNTNENKTTILYREINIIFENCKIVGSKLQFSGYILNLVNKKIYTKEKQMILMLEFIEQTVDYLINKINYYMNKSGEIKNYIAKVKLDIEKEHKIEKSRLQMMMDLQKIKTLKEKVEKRSNKIYFLPTKKIDINKLKIKKETIKLDKDKKIKDTIEDYLYNEKEDNEK